ncbi:uncharacterized protein DS421_20g695990 [Arachis hypogaea]|nr:uncharacterized protein DS421_20g695990 [Arachis hypogaea]
MVLETIFTCLGFTKVISFIHGLDVSFLWREACSEFLWSNCLIAGLRAFITLGYSSINWLLLLNLVECQVIFLVRTIATS